MQSFNPPVRTLMGSGPSDVHPRILSAMAKPTIGHLDPIFIAMMDEIKEGLKTIFKTDNKLTMPISAPGSAGMEACFTNLVEPNDKVIICINGVFGMRMKENVTRLGGKAIIVKDNWGEAISTDKLEHALKNNPNANIVAFVHAETSTGAQSDVKTLCKLAHQYDCITIVDAVTSLGGTELYVDEWEIDAIYSGTQKCLSAMPGISLISFGKRAIQKLNTRKTSVNSWFLDLNLIMNYWNGDSKRTYHHTAPVNMLYGLHESLVMILEEGIENSWVRHKKNHELLKNGLEAMNINFLVNKKDRLPQLNSVLIPKGFDDEKIRSILLNDYNLEISAGLGAYTGKIWRIGLMGYSSRKENIVLCLSALKEILRK
ncbi:pyridoxal-phosphate-dependent aminotransferase family protein [Candidatus Vesicomyidisocius calyptogenae]|uniref:Aminotransferase, class V n=1 Tax=Vesicomyosocius okutanii subsp. Calyptogena okutanii (strain HA) TaxID=412965 RepID=A5CXA8_VESOH|nr:alanine--glyoxylate aminotransferase family protein [Candidatus Vesicomyosocius okutanii]BAF61422.1 aminotransferase, class V [Candidatus Vesicomyosocius okutanii]